MDYLEEAKADLVISLAPDTDEGEQDIRLRYAKVEALISIAESLQTLALAARDSAIDVHEVK